MLGSLRISHTAWKAVGLFGFFVWVGTIDLRIFAIDRVGCAIWA